jgi:hypothetical protein
MCNWGDNLAICAFVSMCLYTSAGTEAGLHGKTSCAIWNKLSFCHTAFMSTWWKENVNARRSCASFHSFQHPGGSWQLWFDAVAASTGNHKQSLPLPLPQQPLMGDPAPFTAGRRGNASPSTLVSSSSRDSYLPWHRVHFELSKCPIHMQSKALARGFRVGDAFCSFDSQWTLLNMENSGSQSLACFRLISRLAKGQSVESHPQNFWFDRTRKEVWGFAYLITLQVMLLIPGPHWRTTRFGFIWVIM